MREKSMFPEAVTEAVKQNAGTGIMSLGSSGISVGAVVALFQLGIIGAPQATDSIGLDEFRVETRLAFNQLSQLHEWHNIRDRNGVFRWMVPAELQDSIDENTEAIRELSREVSKLLDRQLTRDRLLGSASEDYPTIP